ncbi:uncharacterized protein BYT42DRAFT_584556 [Radiomyces spectabilis]|uniref:uncharacterized protein n=1 Tax=Radiomyces spectabilis TaxID=64574 RepID=UPI002220D398|nr:uncharacterized protein BYT42DRAFT_584556 [Radiomyces spectabilis]KAI8369460.1 hypothetical protein BYT42DRAFT_584556 [Radiomyces spectabilis]
MTLLSPTCFVSCPSPTILTSDSPPPYPPTPIYRRTKRRYRVCHICDSRDAPQSMIRFLEPFLIHTTKRDMVNICLCPKKAHAVCVMQIKDEYRCDTCQHVYQLRWRVGWTRFICVMIHVLSLGSTVGLVVGLAHLGQALDQLALGSEAGAKLDGDETWQDHEMQQIVEWLNIVHFTTGLAGEALLGLVYLTGLCSVIGLDRTLDMIRSILRINLEPIMRLPLPRRLNLIVISTITLPLLSYHERAHCQATAHFRHTMKPHSEIPMAAC